MVRYAGGCDVQELRGRLVPVCQLVPVCRLCRSAGSGVYPYDPLAFKPHKGMY